MTQIYHLPVLSRPDLFAFRAPGPGLGNLLFPIARAVRAQKNTGGVVVLPTLRQIKIGTYLRQERDKRTYGDIFRPRSITEAGHWIKAALLPQRDETEENPAARVVRYAGMGSQFYDLQGYETNIRDFLKYRSKARLPEVVYDVAVHVRQTDFQPPEAGAALQNAQIPLAWYREAFLLAKEFVAKPNPSTIVFTDANPLAIIEELGIEQAISAPEGNALTSIFAMSQARIIIASRSTFSAWAQYLGGTYAVWPSGFRLDLYKPIDTDRDFFL